MLLLYSTQTGLPVYPPRDNIIHFTNPIMAENSTTPMNEMYL